MLTIRLQRTGKKNKVHFRLILAQKTTAANKDFVEILGSYNPHTKAFVGKTERITYWLEQHVEVSPSAHNLLVTHGVISSPKKKAFSAPAKAKPEADSAEGSSEAPTANDPTDAQSEVPEGAEQQTTEVLEAAEPAA